VGSPLVAEVKAALRAAAEPERAPGMQAYMKSAMPYLGVRVPIVRRLTRAAAADHPFADRGQLESAVRELWDGAAYREERYAATALCDTRSAQRLRESALLPLYRDLIVDGAWWDHVDELAHRVGELLLAFPGDVRPELHNWTGADDRWLRRVSIICQLGARQATDIDLLTEAIEANAAERDFFLRKAIGWALRDYARTDPAWVIRFVAAHQLSPLSQREALRHVH
jgi:3-methyladenine DNA glycosylase AlkD